MTVDGTGVFAHQRRTQCAHRAGITAAGQLAEEDVAWVLSQNFGKAAGVLLHIGLDALHAGLTQRQIAFVRHIAADGNIRMFVFIGKSDTDVFAGRRFQTT
ncbi:Uncharacterised protein [Mycobacteroides abscessus subsp. massiliense]|nr:Uncharacterised protein [Mycobacteroides abscessus subsp. massiliense]